MSQTLQLRNPSVRFLGLTSGILLLFLILCELFFRMDAVEDRFPAASFGSQHRQLEIQFARLDRLVENEGPVECIFLGNSMVWLGVNPQIVTQVIEERTGLMTRCFNFGISAMPASSAGMLASILVDKYHPNILIYGTFARDFSIPAEAEDAFVIANTPWIRYKSGEMNIAGWIYDVSIAYRHRSQVVNLLSLNFSEFNEDNFGPEVFRAYGLDPKTEVVLDVTQSPDPQDVRNANAIQWLYDYKIQPENLDGLRQILQQSEKGVQVVVIEMPFYKTGFQFFKNGKQDYEQYVNQVALITTSNGIRFWRISEQVKIEADGWWDILHFNLHGANQFSEWVGNQLSDAFLQGSLVLSNSIQ